MYVGKGVVSHHLCQNNIYAKFSFPLVQKRLVQSKKFNKGSIGLTQGHDDMPMPGPTLFKREEHEDKFQIFNMTGPQLANVAEKFKSIGSSVEAGVWDDVAHQTNVTAAEMSLHDLLRILQAMHFVEFKPTSFEFYGVVEEALLKKLPLIEEKKISPLHVCNFYNLLVTKMLFTWASHEQILHAMVPYFRSEFYKATSFSAKVAVFHCLVSSLLGAVKPYIVTEAQIEIAKEIEDDRDQTEDLIWEMMFECGANFQANVLGLPNLDMALFMRALASMKVLRSEKAHSETEILSAHNPNFNDAIAVVAAALKPEVHALLLSEAVSVLESLAGCRQRDGGLIDSVLVTKIGKRVNNLNGPQILMTVLSMVALRIKHYELLDLLAHQAVRSLEHLTYPQLGELKMAFEAAGLKADHHIFSTLTKTMAEKEITQFQMLKGLSRNREIPTASQHFVF
eukprot:Platyproteum_vivax@DN8182_c0_g1_i1.p1